jgi:hypothetical protein
MRSTGHPARSIIHKAGSSGVNSINVSLSVMVLIVAFKLDLVLIGSGMYTQFGMVVCSVFPKITTVAVDYSINSKLFNSTSPNFLNSSHPVISSMDAPWLGDFSTNIFLQGLYVGQGILGNSMGDSILAFWQALPNPAEVANEVIVSYLRRYKPY